MLGTATDSFGLGPKALDLPTTPSYVLILALDGHNRFMLCERKELRDQTMDRPYVILPEEQAPDGLEHCEICDIRRVGILYSK